MSSPVSLSPPSAPSEPAPGLHSRLAGRRRIPAVLWDAVTEARDRIADASACAAALIERARLEATGIQAAAAAEGRDEGLGSVAELHAAALRARDRLLEEAREELVELAFAIAERVVGELVRAHPQLVVDAATRAIEESRARLELTIRASAEDLAKLRAAEPVLGASARGTIPRLRFVVDESVTSGDVVVETELGRVEASIGAQLRALRRAVGFGAGAGR